VGEASSNAEKCSSFVLVWGAVCTCLKTHISADV